MALMVKNLPANEEDVRDSDSIPGLGRSLGGRKGYPLQYSGYAHFRTGSQIITTMIKQIN